jgi:uncharacterized protein YhbP (UPF0306 family)
MDPRITRYLLSRNVLTLATVCKGAPYCCNLFYAFDDRLTRFYFLSSTETQHIRHALENELVAGTVTSPSRQIARLRGIQFTGRFFKPEGLVEQAGRQLYLRRFPLAVMAHAELWAVDAERIKMTDNTLGFGTKLHWSRQGQDEVKTDFSHGG